jgi:CRISPR/Cas system-associated exonuclease Cas4 (RecB family)
MTPFLKIIADRIIEKHGSDLRDVTVVVPGKRAGLFLEKYLFEKLKKAFFVPKVVVLPEFFQSLVKVETAGKVELSLLLYEAHLQCAGSNAEPFESFHRWAASALDDFNDIEQSLVQPLTLFKDLRSIKEIENWSFNEEPLRPAQLKYLAFWNSLGDLYQKFNELQEQSGRWSYARLVRHAAEKRLTSPAKHTWFVGLASLTAAEKKVVDHHVAQNLATCLWDVDAYYINNIYHEAGSYFRKWPRKNELIDGNGFLEIPKKIIHGQSNSMYGEIHACISEIQKLSAEELNRSVVVVTDDKLIEPLLFNMPALPTKVNVALGLTVKHSNIGKAIQRIIGMHTGYIKSKGIYHAVFMGVLAEPSIGPYAGDLEKILAELSAKRIVHVDDQRLKDLSLNHDGIRELMFLFSSENQDPKVLLRHLSELCLNVQDNDEAELERESARTLIGLFGQCIGWMEKHNYLNTIAALRVLFSQVLSRESIHFTGEPLDGLQILGMVETRAVDFDNVFVVGANDDVFPGTMNYNSLIPYDVRLLYQMPMPSDKEVMYAYTFYRMISRSSRVWMFSSLLSSDFKVSEKCRYIPQLESELSAFNPISSITTERFAFDSQLPLPEPDAMPADDYARARMATLFESGLSPSALNTYINCPLDFYYKYILGLGEKDQVEEQIDSATFGSIVHHVLEIFYQKFIGSAPTKADFDELRKGLSEELDKAIVLNFGSAEDLRGMNFLARTIAEQMLLKIIQHEENEIDQREKEGLALQVVSIEDTLKAEVPLPQGHPISKLVLRGKTDRIDVTAGVVRIVDYKTGKVESKDVTIAKPIEAYTKGKHGKLLQLLAYIYLQRAQGTPLPNIRAALYSLKNFGEGYQYLNDKVNTEISEEQMKEFEDILIGLTTKMYNSTLFEHNEDADFCEYCNSKG